MSAALTAAASRHGAAGAARRPHHRAPPRPAAAAAVPSPAGGGAPADRAPPVTVVPRSQSRGGAPHPDPSVPVYPDAQEEREVSHEAFMHAFEASRPRAMRIPGMQEFAASLWNRRTIPSSSRGADPLAHIFGEFDADGDGRLSAREVAAALNSRGVQATEEQVQMFIEASDDDHDHLVSREEFAQFIYRMASADLRSVSSLAASERVGPAGGGGGRGGGGGGGEAAPKIVLPQGMGGSPGESLGGSLDSP